MMRMFRTRINIARIIIILFLMILLLATTITSTSAATSTSNNDNINAVTSIGVDPDDVTSNNNGSNNDVIVSSLFFLRGSHHQNDTTTTTANKADKIRFLKSSQSHTDFNNEWNSLNPDQQLISTLLSTFGLVIIFLFCWCTMACLCNCVRSCFCSGRRGHYQRIDDNNNYNNHNGNHNGNGNIGNGNENRRRRRPCMNMVWTLCCFECCCRGNQDIDCCN